CPLRGWIRARMQWWGGLGSFRVGARPGPSFPEAPFCDSPGSGFGSVGWNTGAGWCQAGCRRGRTRGEQPHPVCGMCCTQAVLLVSSPPLPAAGTQNLSRPPQKAQIFVDNIYCARKLPTKNRLTWAFSVLLLSTVAAVVSQDFGGLRGFLRVRRA